MRFEDLSQQHGGDFLIPHDALYAFLLDNKQDLIHLAQIENIPASALGREVRRRCKRDLFWLSRYFTWETNPEGAGRPISENKLTEATHKRICDFFVQKDDSKSLADQDVIKNRLLLWPRGGFKSTIDIVDVVQWILNFPEIRVLFLTAADDLAIGFLDQTKGHFLIREKEPTLMNLFFPEFCVADQQGNQFEFTCPVWAAKQVKRAEPTVLASSIASTLSGLHFEVIKADDVVSNKNSENEDQCRKVTKNLSVNKKMLRPFGYYDKIGTRYLDEDDYGTELEKIVGDVKTWKDGPCVERIDGPGIRVLIGRAIVIKPETIAQLEKDGRKVSYMTAGADGCDLLLPDILGYGYLILEYQKDELSFEGQYNQNPKVASRITFDKPTMEKATISCDRMPIGGPISQTWDFAFSKKKNRDFCTASSVIWNNKSQMYVHDLVRNRFRPAELAQAVVDFAKRYKPFVIGIEDAGGSRFLEPTIHSLAEATGDAQVIAVCKAIDWIKVDTSNEAKKSRMGALHPWLVQGRMFFADYIPSLSILYDEFEKCLTSSRFDDIPDVLSQQVRYAPRIQQMAVKNEMPAWSQADASWNLLFEEGTDPFGRPGMAAPPPVVEINPGPELPSIPYAPGLDNMLGAGICG